MKKDNFIRYLKKEYLIFKKERLERHGELFDGIKSVLEEGDFFAVDSQVLQAFQVKLIYQGIESPVHPEFNKYYSCEVSFSGFPCVVEGEAFNSNNDDWLCVIPSEWELCGGFLVLKEVLFSNLLNLSHFMQDDFNVYDSSLHSVIAFRGDRSGEDTVNYDITARGDYFSFFFDALKRHSS
jgi:hypothetical protein